MVSVKDCVVTVVALMTVISKTQSEHTSGINDIDLKYMHQLYSMFRDVLHTSGNIAESMAVMGFDYAGISRADELYPSELEIVVTDRYNYVAAVKQSEEVIDHVVHHLLYAVRNMEIISNFKNRYFRLPDSIHIVTSTVPCQCCVDNIMNTMKEFAPKANIFIAFVDLPFDRNLIGDLIYAENMFHSLAQGCGHFHFFPDPLGIYIQSCTVMDTTGTVTSTNMTALIKDGRQFSSFKRVQTGLHCEDGDITGVKSFSDMTRKQCLSECDNAEKCAAFNYNAVTSACNLKSACSANRSDTPGILYLKTAHPQPGTWFLMRNVLRGKCLVSCKRGDQIINRHCYHGSRDEHFGVIETVGSRVILKSRDSGKCLESRYPDPLVHADCEHYKESQLWQIWRISQGNNIIQNYKHRLCLYLRVDRVLGVYNCGYDDQFWSFDPVPLDPLEDQQEFVNGWLMMKHTLRQKCIFSEENVFSQGDWDPKQAKQQYRLWKPRDSSTSMIVARVPDKCLTATQDHKVDQATCDTSDQKQQWLVRGDYPGPYELVNDHTNKCMYMNSALVLGQRDNCSHDYQFWSFESIPQPYAFNIDRLPSGWMTIKNKLRERCVVSSQKRQAFGHYICHPEYNDQWFRLWHPTARNTLIQSASTEKCIGTTSGSDVTHVICNLSDTKQIWEIRGEYPGPYQLMNVSNKKCFLLDANTKYGLFNCGYGDQYWFLEQIG